MVNMEEENPVVSIEIHKNAEREVSENYYEILGLPKHATDEEVKNSYRTLAVKYHPDKTNGDKEEAIKKFQLIAEAYSVLIDPEKRKEYDHYGRKRHGDIQSGEFSLRRATDLFEEIFGTKAEASRWWQGSSSGFDFETEQKLADACNKDTCAICGLHGKLLCCDGPCFRSFHLKCINLKRSDVPEGEWFCVRCSQERSQGTITLFSKDSFRSGYLATIPKATKFNNAAEEPLTSAIRGLDFLFHATCEKDAFDAFGADSIQFFHDIATFSVEPTRDRSLRYAEQLAQWWKTRTILTNLENCEETTLLATIRGVYSLERVGVEHTLKISLQDQLQKRSGQNFLKRCFGFDPSNESPPCRATLYNGLNVTQFSCLRECLRQCFYAHRVGVSLGCTFLDALNCIESIKPYKTISELKELAKSVEYMYCQKPENSENIENIENIEKPENTENTENTENIEKPENSEKELESTLSLDSIEANNNCTNHDIENHSVDLSKQSQEEKDQNYHGEIVDSHTNFCTPSELHTQKDLFWWELFVEQSLLICEVVGVLSNWGELVVDPNIFKEEWLYLTNECVDMVLEYGDSFVIASVADALKSMGMTWDDQRKIFLKNWSRFNKWTILMQRLLSAIIFSQKEDGSWRPEDKDPENKEILNPQFVHQYTVQAVRALVERFPRGYGPSIPSSLVMIQKWNLFENKKAQILPNNLKINPSNASLALESYRKLTTDPYLSIPITLPQSSEIRSTLNDPQIFEMPPMPEEIIHNPDIRPDKFGKLRIWWLMQQPVRDYAQAKRKKDSSTTSGLTTKSSSKSKKKGVKKVYENTNPAKERFMQDLYKFMHKRGTPLPSISTLFDKPLDLYIVFQHVIQNGGFSKVEELKIWEGITEQVAPDFPNRVLYAAKLKELYKKQLLPFERLKMSQTKFRKDAGLNEQGAGKRIRLK